jgi:GMP synthase-like glutamine amidotransferase
MHRDILYDIPSSLKPLGSTTHCRNHGMYDKGRLITVQGHPEFTHDIVEELLIVRQKNGIFPEGVYDDGMRRLMEEDDGVVVGQAFLRFLLEE